MSHVRHVLGSGPSLVQAHRHCGIQRRLLLAREDELAGLQLLVDDDGAYGWAIDDAGAAYL